MLLIQRNLGLSAGLVILFTPSTAIVAPVPAGTSTAASRKKHGHTLGTRVTPAVLAARHITTTVQPAAQTNVGLPLLKGWALPFEY